MLSFERLREVNLDRCITQFNHPLTMWSVAEWGAATIGEGGEALNVAKKMLRVRDGMEHFNKGVTWEELVVKLREELADLVIYADLWAAAADIDLEKAIRDKFNADSLKHGVEARL